MWESDYLLAVCRRHHVRVGGDGRHRPDPSVELPEATQRGHSRGAEQETGQQGVPHSLDVYIFVIIIITTLIIIQETLECSRRKQKQ